VLRALGLLEALQGLSFYPQFIQLRTGSSGFLLAQLPLGALAESRYGAPYLHIHRGDLHAVLLAAVAERGIICRLSKRCTGLSQTAANATIEFEDGTSSTHNVIVGADGIHSALRQLLIADTPPKFTGHVAWRGLVPVNRLPKNSYPPTVTAWLGPRKHFVNYYVRGGDYMNFVGVVEDPHWQEESWVSPADSAQLRKDFGDWHLNITTLIEASEDVNRWALYDRAPLDQWSFGRTTLLGDACHPMLPYLAQGAAMAIEDAWVLSRMLEQWEDEPASGLIEYEKYRRPRTRRVQLGARAQGKIFHLTKPLDVWRRNAKLGFGSRFLPELAMQQSDWIYAYDAVNGFE
jgi:salicylate hydroxylase